MTRHLEFVTYCGLYCGLCAARTRIPQRAAALQEAMIDEGWPVWGASVPGFAEFWRFLENLFISGGCSGCRAGGGPPECRIRECARQRDLELCNQCVDFPCERIEALGTIYPTLITDNRRMQAVRLDRWLKEQEARAQHGVVYADTRYDVEEIIREQAFGKVGEDGTA
jgi:hypothetical protein